MKTSEELNKKLKALIESNSSKPDSGLWHGIENKLELEESWEEVSGQLEVENLWPSVAARLAKTERAVRIEEGSRYLSAIAIVLVLLLAIFYPRIGTKTDAGSQFGLAYQQPANWQSIPDLPIPKYLNEAVNSRIQEFEPLTATHKVQAVSRFHLSNSVGEEQLSAIAAIEGREVAVNYSVVDLKPVEFKSIKPSLVKDNSTSDDKTKRKGPKLIAVGLTSAAKLGRMMNDETRRSLQPTSLISSRPGFSSGLGLSSEFSLNDRTNLLAEFKWNHWRQLYRDYQNGFYQEYYQGMNGYNTNLIASYGLGKSQRFRTLAGLSFSYTTLAYKKQGSQVESLENLYNPLALGSNLGLEYNLPVGKEWTFAYGVRFYTDLSNLYRSSYTSTYNLSPFRRSSLDFTMTIKHLFNK